jgi:hypothetical protein
VGETRVDLLHLLEDLADAYPGAIEETVVTEIVANSLDSGATTIAVATDAAAATLAVIDDGSGMRRADLRRFHDVAASGKTRGEGIGFAGVGIKLGLLVSEEVLTESRRGKDHIATSWAMTNRKRAPWRWVAPSGLVGEHGTAVTLRLTNPLSALLDPAIVESILCRHFAALFDPRFDEILAAHYPGGVRFTLNGLAIGARTARTDPGDSASIAVRLARKRKPSAVGILERHDHVLAENDRGIAISTLGKVIKRGWDWLGLSPAAAARVTGLVEAPALAACLTLNKVDFLRAGPRGATYLAYRKALQEAVSAQLADWGDVPDAEPAQRRRAARPVERDLEHVLADLSDDFPILSTLVERRAGGKRKLPTGNAVESDQADGTMSLFAEPAHEPMTEHETDDDARDATRDESQPSSLGAGAPQQRSPTVDVATPSTRGGGPRRPVRLGLTIHFETRPDDPELGRLVESTVWVNDAHPAYRRAAASRSESYHIALSVALALSSLVAGPEHEHAFVSEFLARWGDSVDGTKKRRGKRAARRG